MECEHGQLLIFHIVGREFAVTTEMNKIGRRVPVLHHIEPFLNLASEGL